MKKIILALAAVAALTSSAFAGVWNMIGHLPQGAVNDMAVGRYVDSLGNNCIAVIAGYGASGYISDAYCYDPVADSWTGLTSFPITGNGLAAASASDTLYVNGGYNSATWANSESTFFYDESGCMWFNYATMNMLTPRMNHGLVNIYGQYLYAVGGSISGGMADSTVERLDTQGGPPIYVKPMPQGRKNAVTAVAMGTDGKPHIYVIGGYSHTSTLLNSVIEYDSSGGMGGAWTTKGNMPGPGRWQSAGAVLNGKIYVIGGIVEMTGTMTRRVDIYDPQTNSWSLGDSLPEPLCRAGAFGINNKIYLFGGYNGITTESSDSLWQYRPFAPNPPPLIQPLNNAQINNQTPVFCWGSVPTASQYRIQITTDPTFTLIDIADYLAPSGMDTTYGGITLTPAGDFFWRVKTYDWSVPDSSLWSPVRKLTLDLTPPATPYPATPSDGSYTNNASVYFSWSAVTDARWYRLQVDTLSDYSFSNLIINDSTLTSTGTTIDLTPYGYINARFFWRVEAIDSAGNVSGYHSYPSFTLDQTAPSLTFTYPFSGNVDIDPNADIILGFSEPMNQGTFSFSCSPDPDLLAWTYNWSASGDTVYIGHAVFPSGTTITATINTAQDLVGNNFALNGHDNPWSFTTTDGTPPNISTPYCNNDPLLANNNYTFQVNVTDPGGVGVDSAVVRWATAGYNGYNFSRKLNLYAGDVYQAYIYSNEIGMQGVQYQVEAWDLAGNSSLYPGPTTDDYYIHSVRYSGQYLSTNIPYDVWLMLSIPSDARGANIFGMLSNDLNTYDPKIWRLFEWVPTGYLEISAFANGWINDFGQAYWLRHRWGSTGPITVYLEGVDSSYGNFTNSTITQIPLQNGWNDVGTPFQFEIPWANVVNPPTSVAGPYAYNGSAWLNPSEVLATGAGFMPFKGYSYLNGSASTEYIDITPSSAKKKGVPAGSPDSPAGWQTLVNMENVNGQDNNRFGVGLGTSNGRDQYDYPEPPSGLTGTSGYFRLANDQFCTDIRPELGDGQTWDFAVDCQGQTKLTITLPVEFPAGTECYLADLSRQVSVNVKNNNTYSFTPEPGEKVREFKIVAGQADYAKGVLGGSFALPAATLLAQNRPNPLSTNTAISYQLSADGPVRLAVYNVAGQLVKTLVNRPQMAGRYTISWNGRDESGRQAATGVYFYRLTANGTSAARTMNLIK